MLSELSLIARLAIALHCFERYCRKHNLESPEITELSSYLWDFPVIENPDEFNKWELNQPELVDIGLGDKFPKEFAGKLKSKGISQNEFRKLLESVVEIIFWSFYGATDNDNSLKRLKTVISIVNSHGIEAPPALLFVNSRFVDKHGWGNVLSLTERDKWRNLNW